MIYFTSDPHFSHTNIIKYCNRPFADADEMNKVIVDNWNSVVTDEDTVYLLGDVCFGKFDNNLNLLKQLKGKIHLIVGNHDYGAIKRSEIWETVNKSQVVEYEGYRLLLTHRKELKNLDYQELVQQSNVIHLYGHIHTTPEKYVYCNKSYDVGVDNNNFKPISIDDIFKKLNINGNSLDGRYFVNMCQEVFQNIVEIARLNQKTDLLYAKVKDKLYKIEDSWNPLLTILNTEYRVGIVGDRNHIIDSILKSTNMGIDTVRFSVYHCDRNALGMAIIPIKYFYETRENIKEDIKANPKNMVIIIED